MTEKLTRVQMRALEILSDGVSHSADWLAGQLGYKGARSYLTVARTLLSLGDKGFVTDSSYGIDSPFQYVTRLGDYHITPRGQDMVKGAAAVRRKAESAG